MLQFVSAVVMRNGAAMSQDEEAKEERGKGSRAAVRKKNEKWKVGAGPAAVASRVE